MRVFQGIGPSGRCVLLFLVLLHAAGAALAQPPEAALRGRVLDDHDHPLIGVNVVLPELQRGVVTDREGRFELGALPRDSVRVRFSFIGYETVERTVDLSAGAERLEIILLEETLGLAEVTVEAAGVEEDLMPSARSISVLTAEALASSRGQTLGETLAELPGVTTMETGPAISKPVVRGLRGDRVLIVNAGVALEGQQWGDEHAPEVDPFAPARIEVLKGAAGVEHGTGAIGGVIRLEPPELPSQPGLGGTVSLSGFSNNRQGAGSVRVEGASERVRGLAFRAQASLRRAGDARTPGYVLGNSGFLQGDGALTIGYRTDRLDTELRLSRFRTEIGIYEGAHIGNLADLERAIERGEPLQISDFGYAIGNPRQDVTHDVAAFRGSYRTAAGDRVEMQAGAQRNVRQEYDAHRRFGDGVGLDAPAIDLRLLAQTAEARFRHRPVGLWTGVVGVSGLRQGNVNRTSGYLIPNFRAYTGSVYARETRAAARWIFDAGLRVSYRWMRAHPLVDRTFERRFHEYANVDGAAGLIYQFAPSWSLGVNLGTAWRPPGVNELYAEGVHHGSARYEIGDGDLRAERSRSADATVRHRSARVQLEFSGYLNRIADYIFLLPTDTPTLTIRGAFPTFAYHQADVTLRGFDGAVAWQAGAGLELGARVALIRGRNRETDQPVIYMPADRLTPWARWSLPEQAGIEGGYVELGARLVRRQDHVPEGVDYAPPPPGYALADLGLGGALRIGGLDLQAALRVRNLFDTSYRDYLSRFRYFVDEPGRNVVLHLTIPFGRQAP